jgi:hypothetical protein
MCANGVKSEGAIGNTRHDVQARAPDSNPHQ